MKKIILFSLVCMALLLPAVNTTSNAAAKFTHRMTTLIEGWVLIATSNADEGFINGIEVYRLSTGELARKVETTGQTNQASIDLKGLPSGGYSARIICTNMIITKQFKL